MKKSILIIIAIISSFVIGQYIGKYNGKKEANEEAKSIKDKRLSEKYIVIDTKGITHIKTHCIHLIKDNVGVEYKEVKLLKKKDLNNVCPFCVDAENYENLINNVKDTIKPSGYDYSKLKF